MTIHIDPTELDYLTREETAELLGIPARMLEPDDTMQTLEAFDYRLGASRADVLRNQLANGW